MYNLFLYPNSSEGTGFIERPELSILMLQLEDSRSFGLVVHMLTAHTMIKSPFQHPCGYKAGLELMSPTNL